MTARLPILVLAGALFVALANESRATINFGNFTVTHNGVAGGPSGFGVPGTGEVTVELSSGWLPLGKSGDLQMARFWRENATHVINVTGDGNPKWVDYVANRTGVPWIGYELTFVGADFLGVPDEDPLDHGIFFGVALGSVTVDHAVIVRSVSGQATLRLEFGDPVAGNFADHFFINKLWSNTTNESLPIENLNGGFTVLATPIPIPEPSTMALVGTAIVALATRRRLPKLIERTAPAE